MLRNLFEFDTVELTLLEREVAKRVARVGAAYAAIACALFAVAFWVVGPRSFVPVNIAAAMAMACIAMRATIDATVSIFLLINLVLINLVLLAFIILRARDRLLRDLRNSNQQLAQALEQARAAQKESEASRNEAMAARNEAMSARNEAEAARNEVVAAARSKEQFFANLTHEIRTPLNGILGAAALLDRGRPRTDQLALVSALNASARDLGEVVEGMLDHAKLSVGHFAGEQAPLRAAEIVASVRDLLQVRAVEKNLEFSVSHR